MPLKNLLFAVSIITLASCANNTESIKAEYNAKIDSLNTVHLAHQDSLKMIASNFEMELKMLKMKYQQLQDSLENIEFKPSLKPLVPQWPHGEPTKANPKKRIK